MARRADVVSAGTAAGVPTSLTPLVSNVRVDHLAHFVAAVKNSGAVPATVYCEPSQWDDVVETQALIEVIPAGEARAFTFDVNCRRFISLSATADSGTVDLAWDISGIDNGRR